LERHCVVCGRIRDAHDFIRVSKGQKGRIILNETSGDGIVLCRDPDCVRRARETRVLESRFGAVTEDAYLRIARKIRSATPDKPANLVGMGLRSRKIVLGRTGVEQAMRSGKVRLILISRDTQKHTREWAETQSRMHHIPLVSWPGPGSFEDVVHKANCRVAGIMDEGIAEAIGKILLT